MVGRGFFIDLDAGTRLQILVEGRKIGIADRYKKGSRRGNKNSAEGKMTLKVLLMIKC